MIGTHRWHKRGCGLLLFHLYPVDGLKESQLLHLLHRLQSLGLLGVKQLEREEGRGEKVGREGGRVRVRKNDRMPKACTYTESQLGWGLIVMEQL